MLSLSYAQFTAMSNQWYTLTLLMTISTFRNMSSINNSHLLKLSDLIWSASVAFSVANVSDADTQPITVYQFEKYEGNQFMDCCQQCFVKLLTSVLKTKMFGKMAVVGIHLHVTLPNQHREVYQFVFETLDSLYQEITASYKHNNHTNVYWMTRVLQPQQKIKVFYPQKRH